MECTECKLCTRLTDRLRCDNTDNLALLHHTGCSQVATITLCADTMTRYASEHRTDIYRLDWRLLDSLGYSLGNLLASLAQHLACEWMYNIVQCCTAQDAVIQSLHNIVVTLDSRSCQTTQCATILLIHDNILCYIDQTTSQVTCIGSLQRCIGQTLTSTVGRDKVLQHGQTLLEVRQDRVLDNLLTSLDT